MKMREEHETVVGDGDVLLRVLDDARPARLVPLREVSRGVRRRRTSIIAIDETPVGTFVEIEGGEAGILAMTPALGRSPADFILDSYRDAVHRARRDALRAAAAATWCSTAE